MNEVGSKIPNIINLASTIAFTAVECKISNVNNLVKKTHNNTKLVKLKIKLLLIMITINTFLFRKLIRSQNKILLQD